MPLASDIADIVIAALPIMGDALDELTHLGCAIMLNALALTVRSLTPTGGAAAVKGRV
jgi:hypothetical protein